MSEITKNVNEINCNSKEFKKIFLDKSFTPEEIQKAKNICTFVQNLCIERNIQLNDYDTIVIIIESLEKMRNIYNYKDYVRSQAKLLMSSKGFIRDMIKDMLDKGIFKKKYEIYQNTEYKSIITNSFEKYV
jgi:hypothetical protein